MDYGAIREIDAPPAPSRDGVWRMFDRIAGRYDLLNRVLSFRRDVAWRKRIARHLPARPGLCVLDLATGTGDVLLTLCAERGRVQRGVGMDLAGQMLAVGRRKIARQGRSNALTLVRGDAMRVAARDGSFDAVTIAFGIRNVLEVRAALAEMRRVLKEGGRALILEFSLPANALARAFYLFYFRHVLPKVGALVSGDGYAYRYLNSTVESFPHGAAFCDLMTGAGFRNVQAYPLTFGIATLYTGDK